MERLMHSMHWINVGLRRWFKIFARRIYLLQPFFALDRRERDRWRFLLFRPTKKWILIVSSMSALYGADMLLTISNVSIDDFRCHNVHSRSRWSIGIPLKTAEIPKAYLDMRIYDYLSISYRLSRIIVDRSTEKAEKTYIANQLSGSRWTQIQPVEEDTSKVLCYALLNFNQATQFKISFHSLFKMIYMILLTEWPFCRVRLLFRSKC